MWVNPTAIYKIKGVTMGDVKVPQEWPRRKKVRSIGTIVFFIVLILISVN